MYIQLEFENPERISSLVDSRDLLLITVLKPHLFRSKFDDVAMLKNFKTDHKIPP